MLPVRSTLSTNCVFMMMFYHKIYRMIYSNANYIYTDTQRFHCVDLINYNINIQKERNLVFKLKICRCLIVLYIKLYKILLFAQQQDVVEIESAPVARPIRRRKTSQNDHSHGSFFLRIGAIGERKFRLFTRMKFESIRYKILMSLLYISFSAFGLGTMIYNGLEFGTFFELPLISPCYLILKGVNPVLQMVFTFMQMYFIFMNSRVSCI